jgi:hypothetical protein
MSTFRIGRRFCCGQRDSFNRLPHHIRAIDAGTFQTDGTTASLGEPEEFFLLTEFAEDGGYFPDLERIAKTGIATELDVTRADALCDYLVDIHQAPGPGTLGTDR